MKLTLKASDITLKGGAGSGHHGHSGRPGKVGGSLPGSGSSKRDFTNVFDFEERYRKYSVPGYSDYRDMVKRSITWDPYGTELIDDEVEAIEYYTESGFGDINYMLRHDHHPEVENIGTIKTIDSLMTAFTAPEDILVYRRTTLGTVGKLKVGDVFSDKAYTSTTLDVTIFSDDPAYADLPDLEGKPVLMYIGVPKNYPSIALYDYSILPDEMEVLLARNTKFKVIDIDNNELFVEVIP